MKRKKKEKRGKRRLLNNVSNSNSRRRIVMDAEEVAVVKLRVEEVSQPDVSQNSNESSRGRGGESHERRGGRYGRDKS